MSKMIKVTKERLVIAIPFAVVKIALSKRGAEDTVKEREHSKNKDLMPYILKCKASLFHGWIGIYQSIHIGG